MTEIVRVEKAQSRNGFRIFFICDFCGAEASKAGAEFRAADTHFCDIKCYGKYQSKTRKGVPRPDMRGRKKGQTRYHDIDILPYSWMLKYNTMKLR